MTDLLVRLFVKNHEDSLNANVRQSYGVMSGIVGIFCNLCLFIGKIIMGLMTGAISIIADAFNNLSDAGSSIITLIGFKMAGRPADENHPYGHGRIEYLSALFISIVILFMGFELITSSIKKIINPEEIAVNMSVLIILLMSIFLKLWMFLFNRKIGKRIHSAAMKATAMDSISDCLTTSAVLIAMGINYFTGYDLDGYMGVIVALFILYAGLRSAIDAVQPLIGKAPDAEFIEKVTNIVYSNPEIKGMHDLLIHDYGPSHSDVSLDVEMSSTLNLVEAHAIISEIEDELKKKYNCDVTIHIDPMEHPN